MKRSYFVVLLLVSGLLLTSCGGGTPATPTSAPAAATTAATAGSTAVAQAGTTAATAAPTAAANATEISIVPVNPKATSTPGTIGTPPADGGKITGPEGTEVAVTQIDVNPPPTLDDLLKQYPDLKAFIDKLPPDLTDSDLGELYKRIVQIYKDRGASGVAVFLKDSGILDKLGIPVSYVDLLTAYGDKGDLQAVEKLARDRRLINDKNEIIGFLAIDAPENATTVSNDLKALGVSVYTFNVNTDEVEIGVPLAILSQLQTPEKLLGYLSKIAKTAHVVGFRPPSPRTVKKLNLQQFNTKGAAMIGADKWHDAGITGKGVRIGILDMGFGGIAKYAGKQLPEADAMKSNIPLDELDEQEEDHGTACAMVVHGAAPDAELFIAWFDGSSDESWEEAVNFLIENKVQIVNYSVGSAVGPRDGTFGESIIVEQIVEDNNILWVNAAGNEAVDHTMFQYKDNGKGVHAFTDKVAALPFVPFAPITTVIMNWNGNWKGKERDEYDFRILDKEGNEVAIAAEPKKGKKNDFPFQGVSFEAEPKQLYFMQIHKEKGSKNATLDIFIPNAVFPDWAQVPDHSVTVPGDANAVLTVGATGLSKDELEFYSSQGPTNDDRIKPDLTAPTGEILPIAPKGFSGTSGAAPLVAGAAGLVLQKFPDMTVEELKAFLTSNVKDLGDDGPDPQFGAGRLEMPDPGDVNSDDPGTTDSTEVPDSDGPTATITNVDAKFNVKYKGKKGMAIFVSFEVDNFKGRKGIVAAMFYDKSGKPLPASDKKYQIGNGLGAGFPFEAKSDQAAFDDTGMFIPYTAMSGIPEDVTEFYFVVYIFDPDNLEKPLAQSDPFGIKVGE
jgi:hypothetical protein